MSEYSKYRGRILLGIVALCAAAAYMLHIANRQARYDPLWNIPSQKLPTSRAGPFYVTRFEEEQVRILSSESLDESFAMIADVYEYPGRDTGNASLPPDLEMILSSRRTAKLIVDFEALGPLAKARCRDALQAAIDQHHAAIDSALSHDEDPARSPPNTTDLAGSKYRVCTMMLIAADLGDVEAIVAAIRQLQKFETAALERIELLERMDDRMRRLLDHLFRERYQLDDDFVVNVMIYAASRGQERTRTLNQHLAEMLAESDAVSLSSMEVMAWDALVTRNDRVRMPQELGEYAEPGAYVRSLRIHRLISPDAAQRQAFAELAERFLAAAEELGQGTNAKN